MNQALSACFALVTQAFFQCATADAASVMPVFTNDTVANTLSFNDTFGHNVAIGTYNSATGLWTATGVAGGFTNLSVSGNATVAGTTGLTGQTTVSALTATGLVNGAGFTSLFASPPPIGSTAANTGAFTTLSASGAVSGAGFNSLITAPPLGIGSVTPNGGAFTTLSASGVVSGTGFANYLLSPPAIGNTAPNTGKFTTFEATGAGIFDANLNITNTGADGATLYSTTGFGFPGTKSGFFTSGLNSLAMRYISTYFAQTAIYATTTRNSTQGETGVYLEFNNLTGYQAPGGTTGQKAAMQISGDCASGGGYCWDEAMSLQFDSGWQGASGNFGTVLEVDPSNNSGTTVPTGGSVTNIFGLWLAGNIGANPITAYLQIAPAAINGAVFAAHYGINISGSTTIQDADIITSSSAVTSINTKGTHALAAIEDDSTSPIGLNLNGTNSTAQAVFNATGTNQAWATPSFKSFARGNGQIGGTNYISTGSVPVNSGSCAITAQYGAETVGGFKASGACAGGTYILTFPTSVAPLGWTCFAVDQTTPADAVVQTTANTTSVTFKATTVNLDFVNFNCMGY